MLLGRENYPECQEFPVSGKLAPMVSDEVQTAVDTARWRTDRGMNLELLPNSFVPSSNTLSVC